MAKCRLCLQERDLRKSHIIPEYFYKTMYDSKHRMVFISNDKTESLKYRNKGVYEKILCDDCEQKLNSHENYMINLFKGIKDYIVEENNDFVRLMNIDYDHFRLFALSILWRASVSTNRLFEHVDLGTNEEILRKMMYEEDSGKYDKYPIVMASITSEGKYTAKDLITAPELIELEGAWAYRFVFGGFVWIFIFGNNDNFKMRRFYFKHYGSIIISKKEMSEINFIVGFGIDLFRQGKLNVDLNKLRR